MRCQDPSSAIRCRGAYHLREVGVPATAFTITGEGEHAHDEQGNSDPCRVLDPAQEKTAEACVAANSELSLRGLTNHLVAAGFNQQLLPDRARMSRWLLNHNPPVKSPFSRAVPPRAELMKRSVDQWPGAKSINAGEPDACFPKLGPLFVQPSKERRVCVCVCVCVCVSLVLQLKPHLGARLAQPILMNFRWQICMCLSS